MSNYSVVRDISQEMRRRIYTALETTPDNDFGLPTIEQAIALEPPGERISDNTTQLSLFLYHIEVDPHNRNQPRLRIAPDGLLRPEFRIRGLPGVVFVDAEGRVTHVEFTVIRSYRQLTDLVEEHLGVSL